MNAALVFLLTIRINNRSVVRASKGKFIINSNSIKVESQALGLRQYYKVDHDIEYDVTMEEGMWVGTYFDGTMSGVETCVAINQALKLCVSTLSGG